MTKNIPVWSTTGVYTVGQEVTFDGVIYIANWWTQGDNPAQDNGGPGSGKPWTVVDAGSGGSTSKTVPSAPGGLAASATSATATTLSWTPVAPPTGQTITDYIVYENGTAIGATTSTSYVASGLTGSTRYSFTVAAEDAAGTSAQSSALQVATGGAVPSAPGGLKDSSTSSAATTLSWTAVAPPSGETITDYVVYENGKVLGTTTTTSFAVSGLTASTSYAFTVAAQDAAGTSAQSSALSVKTTAAASIPIWSATAVYTQGMEAQENNIVYAANWWTQDQDPAKNSGASGGGEPWTIIGAAPGSTTGGAPTVPAGLAAAYTTSNSTTLSWNAAAAPIGQAVTGYDIYENGKEVATTTSTRGTVTGLAASTAYTFSVSAVDADGASPTSSAVSVTTAAAAAGGAASVVFAPYIDMGLTQDENLVAIAQASGIKTFTLAFIQSSGQNQIGWGGTGTIAGDKLADGSTILQQVQNLRAIGGNVIISFGGSAGTDPAVAATSASALQAEYQSVINRYGVTSLDFDVEGAAIANTASIHLRDQALLGLEAANPGLQISFTIPVLPTGPDSNGQAFLQDVKNDGVDPNVVNIMTMDYGSAVDNGGAMGQDAIDAVQATAALIKSLGLKATIGVTPMIGVNDVSSEVFTLADAQLLSNYASGAGSDIGRLSMWSVARDNGSGAGATWASPTASGLAQSAYQFSSIFEKA
ncbi:chitodextrinase [Roseiarcus fermentans]|uniref:Chitodextrinase n=1 Tax=Roseiarcus fermentans TaxID=1473586 RepID=A0A366FKP1_9HYPH|nr:fibronectin type III domain-containing protein [Roseiarcus fermentans]RBP14279.1 chitodextrinase [Roseiarcus fermentans]